MTKPLVLFRAQHYQGTDAKKRTPVLSLCEGVFYLEEDAKDHRSVQMVTQNSSIHFPASLRAAFDILQNLQSLLPQESTSQFHLGVMSYGVEQSLVLETRHHTPVRVVFGLGGPWQNKIFVRYGASYQFNSLTNLPNRGNSPEKKEFELDEMGEATRFIYEYLMGALCPENLQTQSSIPVAT